LSWNRSYANLVQAGQGIKTNLGENFVEGGEKLYLKPGFLLSLSKNK